MPYCGSCKSDVLATDLACSTCGAELRAASDAPTDRADRPTWDQWLAVLTILAVAIVAWLFAAVLFAWGGFALIVFLVFIPVVAVWLMKAAWRAGGLAAGPLPATTTSRIAATGVLLALAVPSLALLVDWGTEVLAIGEGVAGVVVLAVLLATLARLLWIIWRKSG